MKDLFEGTVFGDLYFERTEALKIVLEPDRIEELSVGEESGYSLRRIKENLEIEFSSSTKLEDERINRVVDLSFKSSYFSDLKIKERISFLETLKRKVKGSPYLKHYRFFLTEVVKEVQIYTSEDIYRRFLIPYVRLAITVVAERDGRLERGYEVKAYTLEFEKAKDFIEVQELPERASSLALTLLSARKAPAGIMPVVLSGEAGGTMIHEAVGHGFEADHAEEGLSIYSGKLGEKVASPFITVIDDPTLSHLFGFYPYDDEGTEAQKVVLIEKGVLKNFLYDKFFALKHGKISNGHGRRESFRDLPIPRMSNTYIERGPHKPEEIVKSIDSGLLVKKMGGGEVNPLTGDFVFEIREGYYIYKGEIAYPIKGANLVGNGPKVLEIIDMVGDDLHFEPGFCGKDGQRVPVSDGQPTLRIPEITVGGVVE
ncbi:MAG: TldD/PmbA family protein [Thermodesulfobacteriaceae bacterium]|nr:TldD/PmbA family protein [Thermodesulfobacteriaceae bacterium]MCX8041342.1 TldD/PmbA family protein [Thermodesulfobacteriaceae bacterium]